jgi:hypothetical protein
LERGKEWRREKREKVNGMEGNGREEKGREEMEIEVDEYKGAKQSIQVPDIKSTANP